MYAPQQNVVSGGVSKVTPQGSVVINCGLDSGEFLNRVRASNSNDVVYPDINQDTFSIARGELVFANRKRSGNQFMGKNVPSVQVFSSFNGITKSDIGKLKTHLSDPHIANEALKEAAFEKLADDYWFVGTAQGDKMKRDMENRSLALAVRVAGSDTIYNSGVETIQPGDLVAWRLPKPGEARIMRSGEPSKKVLPVVEKYQPPNKMIEGLLQKINSAPGVMLDYDEFFVNAILKIATHTEIISEASEEQQKQSLKVQLENKPELRKGVQELAKYSGKLQNEMSNQRIIGKALTEGKPGHTFDILLNHTHTVY